MIKLDHLSIQVRNAEASRDWYVNNLGFTVEFEILDRGVVALQDDSGFTLLLSEAEGMMSSPSCTLFMQVDDVGVTHQELTARGVVFEKPPQALPWGYGAELLDPSGYRIGLWDEKSMRANAG
jgi:predicted enzyme related to lactoylglutathione lyase